MNKILIFSIFLILGFTSCNILDVEPTQSLSSDEAIKNKDGVERAINGCYSALQLAGNYGSHTIIINDIAADNLDWAGTNFDYRQFLNNEIETDNAIIESIWSAHYDCINRVNAVLQKMQDVELEAVDKAAFEAELSFIRALCYFNLVRYFGPVPIRTEPASGDNLEGLNTGRSSVEDVYTFIITDLQKAEQSLSDNVESVKASKFAAKALLARVYLTKYSVSNSAADLDLAIQYANDVITNSGSTLAEDFSLLYYEEGNNEIIFQIDFNEQDQNTLARYFYTVLLTGRYEVTPKADLIDAYDLSDERFDYTIGYDDTNSPYCNKYKDVANGSDNVPVIRLAEMYLIKAEALNLKQGDINEIKTNINFIRNRAGLVNTTASDYASLALEIELQRRLEFAFEGYRWFDLIRTGRAVDVLETVVDVNQTLFPIPASEILTNSSPDMYQNPGY